MKYAVLPWDLLERRGIDNGLNKDLHFNNCIEGIREGTISNWAGEDY